MRKDGAWNSFVDQLVRDADISDTALRLGMKLTQRQAARPRAICPFHNDSRPSLNLFRNPSSAKKDAYHCFACGAHGDVLALIRQVRGVGFREAVEWLAGALGRALPQTSGQGNDYSGRISGLALGLEIFSRLSTDEVKILEDFSNLRGFTLKQLKAWKIGVTRGAKIQAFIAEQQKLTQSSLRQDIDNLQEAGLLVRRDQVSAQLPFELVDAGGIQDFFWDTRIIFPLLDEDGEPNGFAGRARDPKAKPKYLYSKGFARKRILYRFEQVQREVNSRIEKRRNSKNKESGWQFDLYIVEGLMDALRLESLGLSSCAVLGSQLTQEQAGLVSRLAEKIGNAAGALNVHLYLDNDEAGRKGAAKSIPLLWDSFRKFDVTPLVDAVALDPERPGKDPDSTFQMIQEPAGIPELLKSSLVPATQVLLADQLDCNPSELTTAWSEKTPSVQQWALSALNKQIPRTSWPAILRRFRPLATAVRDSPIPRGSWQESFLFYFDDSTNDGARWNVDQTARVAAPDIARRDDQALVLAHHLAMASRNQREFPLDDGSWTRLGAALDVILLFYKERLQLKKGQRRKPLEPFLAVNLPKASGGLRLKALPCPEDLTLQQYVLNELLRGRAEDPHFERFIPAVRWLGGQHATTGWLDENGLLDEDSETVSFAYQVDMEVLDGGLPPGSRALFRPFFDCWKDYIRHFQKHLDQLESDKLYVARLDIKSFYDRILRSVVNAKLWRSLEVARKFLGPLINIAPLLESENSDRASTIIDWLCDQSFNFEYRDPDTGQVKRSSYPDMGIPQGPDLSAYLANILLFDLDRRITRTIASKAEPGGPTRRKAIYGRYVDDIVLISTTANHLEELENLVAYELANLGLSLNAKNDLLPPMTQMQVRKWLTDQRSFGSEYGPAPGIDPNLLLASQAWGDAGIDFDRGLALHLLHNQPIEQLLEDRDQVLTNIGLARQAKLRPGDEAIVMKQIWIAETSKLLGDIEINPETIASAVRDDWHKTREIDATIDARNLALTAEDEQAAKFHRSWPDLAALEGLYLALAHRSDRSPRNTSSQQLKFSQIRNRLAEAVLKGLPDLFNGEMKAETPTDFAYQRQLWSLAVTAAAARVIPDSTSSPPIENQNLQSTEATLRHILTIHSVLPGSAVLARMEPKISSPLLHFHEAIARLGAKPQNTGVESSGAANYPFPLDFETVVDGLCQESGVLGQVLRQWLDKSGVAGDDLSETMTAVDESSLRSFINVSQSRTPEHLSPRQRLLSNFLTLTKIVDYRPTFLPVTPGVDGCAGLFAFSEHFLFAILFRNALECTSDLEIDLRGPWPQGLNWSEQDTENSGSGWRVFKAPREGWQFLKEQTHSSFSRLRDQEKTRILLQTRELFDALWRETVLGEDQILIPTSHHILKHLSGRFAILGFPISGAAVGNLAFVTQRYNGSLIPKTVSSEGASLWRLGTSLIDLFQVNDRETAEPGTRFSAAGLDMTENSLPLEIFARHSFARLRGPKDSTAGAAFRVTGTGELPSTIRKALDKIPRFCDAFSRGDNRQLFGLLFSDLFEDHLRRFNIDFASGVLSCSESLIGACRRLLHGADAKIAVDLPSTPEPSNRFKRRPARAWIAFADRLQLLSNGKDDVSVWIDLITTGYRLLGIFENVRAQALERWAVLPLENRASGKWSFGLSHWGIGPELLVMDPYEVHSLEDLIEQATSQSSPRSLQSLDQITLLGWLGILSALSGLSPDNPERPRLVDDPMTTTPAAIEAAETTLKEFALLCARPCGNTPAAESVDFEALCMELAGEAPGSLEHIGEALELLDRLGQIRVEEENSNFLTFLADRGSRAEVRTQQYGSQPIPVWAVRQVSLADAREAWETSGPEDSLTRRGTISLSGSTIVGVGWLTEPFAKLTGIGQEPFESSPSRRGSAWPEVSALPGVSTPPEVSAPGPGSAEATQDPPDKEKFSSTSPGSTNVAQSLDNFKQAQQASWEGRSRSRVPNTARIALFQWNVEPTYRHPLFEACASPKWGETANEVVRALRNLSGPKPDELGAPRKFPSCSEYRRREVLREVLRACRAFDVDILILPEYSMRPDTVDWLLEPEANLGNTSVWAGTYRFAPGYSDSIGLGGSRGNRQDWSSILSVALSDSLKDDSRRVLIRHKKYPAVGMNEIFNPNLRDVKPLIDQDTEFQPVRNRRLNPRKLVCELICSEVFVIANPSNWIAAASAFSSLFTKFNGKIPPDPPLDYILSDAKLVGDYTSYYSTSQFPRRSIILVPAMSTRAVDYTAYGQVGFLASGLTTVFCNAGGADELACGNSCFIGWECWDRSDRKEHHGDPGAGPYHGVEPGIFRQFAHDRGWLGKKEQALVIADIDPMYASEGKPRPQGLLPPLSLVAHLPVVESWARHQLPASSNLPKCCCAGRKFWSILDRWKNFEEFLELVTTRSAASRIEQGEGARSKEARLLDHLDTLAKIADHKDNDWLCKRRDAYRIQYLANPQQPWPPPVAMDWLWVDLEDPSSLSSCPVIEVPAFGEMGGLQPDEEIAPNAPKSDTSEH